LVESQGAGYNIRYKSAQISTMCGKTGTGLSDVR
jgi:hypothetical protein